MANVRFDDVLKLAEQLSEVEQNKLIYNLRLKQKIHKTHHSPSDEGSYTNITREDLINELNNLRASEAFDEVESLYGKYANPNTPEMTEEQFHAELHTIATEWEQEGDEFDTDDN